MKLKLLSVIITVLVCLSGIAGMVLAGSPSDVQFLQLKINGNDVSSGETVYVERGDDVDITLNLKALSVSDIENLKVRAWLGGYEDEVEDVSSMFDLISYAARNVDLSLQLPSDMDASQAYELHIEVYNADGSKEYTSDLSLVKFRIEEVRHKIKIQDVIYGSSVNAGGMLYTKVRIENTGAKDEKDIKVGVSMPELGISTRDYIYKLVYKEVDDDDRTSRNVELALRLPENVETGDYELQVDVEYNKGRELTSATRMVHVKGVAAGASDLVISLDTASQEVAQGEEVAYKLMLANVGESNAVYSAEVAGADAWSDVTVEPGFVSLAPGQAGEIFVNLEVKDDAVEGDHQFTLSINSGEATVKELSLNAEVSEAGLGSLKTGLEVGFAIVVILLVILGLVVAFYKIGGKKKEETPSEPEGLSEETYY